jgi:hypothetical protein
LAPSPAAIAQSTGAIVVDVGTPGEHITRLPDHILYTGTVIAALWADVPMHIPSLWCCQ